jgi:hypothetical protein
LTASKNIGLDHRWVLSVYEFDTDGGYELHVAFVGEARGIKSGYWSNLTSDQCERIVALVRHYKSNNLTCADCASEIVEILKEEPDIDLFESLLDTQSGPVEIANTAPTANTVPTVGAAPDPRTTLGGDTAKSTLLPGEKSPGLFVAEQTNPTTEQTNPASVHPSPQQTLRGAEVPR